MGTYSNEFKTMDNSVFTPAKLMEDEAMPLPAQSLCPAGCSTFADWTAAPPAQFAIYGKGWLMRSCMR